MRRAALTTCLVALGLGACARVPAPAPPPPRAPVAPAATAAPPPAPAAPTAMAPEEAGTPLPPWIARLESPACSWRTERWSARHITELRLRRGGPVFARVNGGRAQVHIPMGARDDGVLDVASNGLVISGVVAREHVTLYAAASFPMSGVLFPRSTTPLSWKEGFDDGVSVTMPAPKGILVNNPPLTARRPCTDLSLDRGSVLSPAKVAFGREYGESRIVRAGQTLEVFADPARPATVKLVLTEDLMAESFATSGAFSRIGAHLHDVYVAGWVRTRNLQESWNGGRGTLSGFGRIGMVSRWAPPLRKVQCPADVPVIAWAGDESATVGHVLSGTTIEVLGDRRPFSPIQVTSRELHIASTAELSVRASDLTACQTLAR